MVRSIRKVAVLLTVTSGVLVAAPAFAGASSAPGDSQSFAQSQQKLEQQLANRQGQLGRLDADVSGSKTLSPVDAATLEARLSTETASIDALATKVPGDTTPAELAADRAAMLGDNRVYAVMTPQVIQTIEADAISAQVTPLLGEESSLQSSVSSLSGQAGYRTAVNHYDAFVSRVTAAAHDSATVVSTVLAQRPQGFPGNTSVFVQANHRLLAANVALAYADYDASVVGLASGGYTGS